jgi:hypothetical protein
VQVNHVFPAQGLTEKMCARSAAIPSEGAES